MGSLYTNFPKVGIPQLPRCLAENLLFCFGWVSFFFLCVGISILKKLIDPNQTFQVALNYELN